MAEFPTLLSRALKDSGLYRLVSVADVIRHEYKGYHNKRLSNDVIKIVQTISTFQCTTWCSMTDGCLAVNVIGNHDITCELTTGLSNKEEMQDDSSSHLLISSKNNFALIFQKPNSPIFLGRERRRCSKI